MLGRFVVAVGLAVAGCAGADGAQGPAGPMGAMGRAGLPGETGPAGKDGSAGWRPVGWFRCVAGLDLISVGTNGLVRAMDGLTETLLDYAGVRYSNGDWEVQCLVNLGSADQGSGSGYFPFPAQGAADRRCFANSDYDSAGQGTNAGRWRFSAQGKVTAVYQDRDNPLDLDGAFYDFGANDCAARTMDDRGVWSDATAADVIK